MCYVLCRECLHAMALSNLLECCFANTNQSCSALDFKGVENKMAMRDGIF